MWQSQCSKLIQESIGEKQMPEKYTTINNLIYLCVYMLQNMYQKEQKLMNGN